MNREMEEDTEKESSRFKMSLIAAHPENANKIASILNDDDEFAEELTSEQMDELGPLSGDQVDEAITAMRQLGLALIDD